MPGERGDSKFFKEQTVFVDVVDNRTVKASDVIKNVEKEVGEGTVLACVPKGSNAYEITLTDHDALELIVDTGFQIVDKKFKPNAIFSRQKVVSLLNVSHYVPDHEITNKLTQFGLELKSPLRRRLYPGTKVADGTRYILVRFPEDRHSLPYTMKLSTGVSSFEYVRVVHDNQKKVCSKCFEGDHVYANCPDNICYKCKRSGHLARACQTPPCAKCKNVLSYCKCKSVWGDSNDQTIRKEVDDENGMNYENNEVEPDTDNDAREEDEEVDVMEADDKPDNVNLVDTNLNSIENDDNLDLVNEEHSKVQSGELLSNNVENIKDNVCGGMGSSDVQQQFSSNANTLGSVGYDDTDSCKANSLNIADEIQEADISDEELTVAMTKFRRRRLVTSPKLSKDVIKRLRTQNKKSNSSS